MPEAPSPEAPLEDVPSVICLTSIPKRFSNLGPTLDSLLAQDLPAPVELWLPETYRRFPEWKGYVPSLPEGVTLRRCAEDWGPATKIAPAVLDRKGQKIDLIFVDDDSIYPPDLHRRLKALRAERPGEALAVSGNVLAGRIDPRLPMVQRRPMAEIGAELAAMSAAGGDHPAGAQLLLGSGYVDFLSGWCGVMVRPDFFDARLALGPGPDWPVDDIWLSSMLEAAGTPIWAEASISPPRRRRIGGKAALTLAEIDGQGRAALDLAAIARAQAGLGIWPARVPRGSGLRRALGALKRRLLGA